MAYIFVHFKEKLTPDGEQVYFSISRDGYHFEQLNGGKPVLTSTLGTGGCRDIEIVRTQNNKFIILSTDLCIVKRMDQNNNVDWKDINHNGSKRLCMWQSDDLIHFSDEKLLDLGREDFGCMWAPEVFYDETTKKYILHWGSTVKASEFNHMSIYYSLTEDFKTFTKPEMYFNKENEILDSHITKVGNTYHLFYKNSNNPPMNMHAVSNNLFGPFTQDKEFEEYMASLGNAGSYEAATTYTLPDGRWCLMLDFFGCEKSKMGYVPFVSEKAGDAHFKMDKEEFSFPYGFKHGKVIEITDDEYNALKEYYAN